MQTEPSTPSLTVASRWRRALAFVVDYALLAGGCALAGSAFFDALAGLGLLGRLFGLALGVAYFGLLDSRVGGGRTLGKRLTGIRVVGADGSPLSPWAAAGRFAILGIPIFLNGLPLPPLPLPVLWQGLTTVLVLGLGLVLLYLFLFNAPRYQSIHDLAVGAVTVPRASARAPGTGGLPRPVHLGVCALLLVASVAVPTALGVHFGVEARIEALHEARTALYGMAGVRHVALADLTHHGDQGPRQYVRAVVRIGEHPRGRKDLARRIVATLVDAYPPTRQRSAVQVVMVHEWSLGFASGHRSQAYLLSPAQVTSP